MSIDSIIAELDAEISRLEQARAVLGKITAPKASKQASARTTKSPKQRKMSAEARERIAAAQRKRWAKQKATKSEPAAPLKKSMPANKQAGSKMSAAGRKRIAAAQQKRWAAINAAKSASKAVPAKKAAPTKKVAPNKAAAVKAKIRKAVPEKPGSTAAEVAAS